MLAIAVLAAGILLMARGVFTSGEDRKLLPFALGSALATATYTLIDGMGARVSGAPAAYVAWVFVADGTIFTAGHAGAARLGRDPAQLACLADGGVRLGGELWGLCGVDLGDDLRADRRGGGAARDLDPVRGADRLAGLWREDDAGTRRLPRW